VSLVFKPIRHAFSDSLNQLLLVMGYSWLLISAAKPGNYLLQNGTLEMLPSEVIRTMRGMAELETQKMAVSVEWNFKWGKDLEKYISLLSEEIVPHFEAISSAEKVELDWQPINKPIEMDKNATFKKEERKLG
jgi:hypothetical protein